VIDIISKIDSVNGILTMLSGLHCSLQLDEWVLCRVRQRTGNPEPKREKGNLIRAKRSFHGEIDPFGKEEIIQNINYFTDNGWHPQESSCPVADYGHLDSEGKTSDHSIAQGSFDPQINMNRSMKDALETIKRVLSLGALDEQAPKQPNKRLRSLNPSSSYLDNSST
jgi:hypothetical protein